MTDVAGVTISSPDRVLWEELGTTKLDLARYVERVAEFLVPHLEGRPLTLVRCPDRVGPGCYFMRHTRSFGPTPLRTVKIREKTKIGEYLVAESSAAAVALVQMGVVEMHTWNSRADDVEHPDRIVFDLDPGPAVEWPAVIEGARHLREILADLGLVSWVKTTGGKGLHVVVPIVPERSWATCLAFAKTIASHVATRRPAVYTISLPKSGREDRILIDYLRNNRTNTSVAAFSPRARPGATVSVPLAWDELGPRLDPARFDMKTVPRRLRRLREDPWRDYFTCQQRLPLVSGSRSQPTQAP